MKRACFTLGRLRGWLCSVLVMIWVCGAAVAAHASSPEPAAQWQHVAVTLKPEKHLLSGESTVIFAPGAGGVSLALSPKARVEWVEVDGKRSPFSFAGGELSVHLPKSQEPVSVAVSYQVVFHDAVSTRPGAGEDPSYGVNGTITREGTFLGGGALWYPVPQTVPRRRSLSVAAPAGMEGISYGRRVSRETVGTVTRSEWEEAHPVGVLSLCAGYYRIEERRVNGVVLYSYLYPDNAALSGRYLDAAAKYISFYSDLFGGYPFEKFAVVENFFPTGYGFPSFTLLGGSVIRLPFIIDTSFPHEIAHSWWGNGIEPDPAEGNWCEGLVTYLADYYLKELRSREEARDYRRQLLIDYASLVTPENDFPLSAFESRSDPASRAIGYGKGAMLFHMVRSRIGDQAFFGALRDICKRKMYGSATWSDFIHAFSERSGEDLAPFMKQWLTRPGAPRLSFSGVESHPGGKRWKVSGSIVESGALYRLAVPVRLEMKGGQVEQRVQIAQERTPFSISAGAAPETVLLDPDAEIFRRLEPAEIPATVNSIKGSTSLIGVITDDCRASKSTFRDLLASLSQETASVIGEAELDPGEARSHDLIFCGMPRNRSLLPSFPREIEVAQRSFTADGISFNTADALLLLVLKRPQPSGKVAALFLPLSEAAAALYYPKITHYGKYGYLVFAGGGNRRKGTPASTDRGVVVDLRH